MFTLATTPASGETSPSSAPSKSVAQTTSEVDGQVRALWQHADASVATGNLNEAERALREASAVATNDASKAGSALRLAAVLTAQGATELAGAEIATASNLMSSLTSSDQLALTNAQGALAARSGDFTAAERSFNAVIEQSRAAGQLEDELRGRLNALRARMDRRDIAGLEDRLGIIRELALRLPPGEESAQLLVAVGELHRRAVNEFRSSALLRKAAYDAYVRARSQAETPATQAYAIGFLGALFEDEQRWEEALKLTAQATFLAQSSNAQDQLFRWEWQAGRIERARNDLSRSERSLDRALATLDPVREDLLRSSPRAYRDLIEPVYLDYADVRLRMAAAMKPGTTEEQQVLRDVRNRLESLKQAEIRDYFQSACVAANQNENTQRFDVDGAAVVYPILLADRIEILMESQGVLWRTSASVSQGQATDEIRRMRIALEQPGAANEFMAPAQSLYRWLLADSEAWLKASGVNTLVIVPSGALRTIPLGALHDGSQFLIERYAVATTPAVSLVASLSPAGFERMLVAGLSEGVQNFPALPSVAQEIKSISAMFPGESLQDRSFKLAAIETELAAPEFTIAHLATHGEFSADHRQSFILAYDLPLTMDKLQSTLGKRGDKPLDMLVLSACKTAAGDDRAALGLAGVAVQAGAKSALASLWNVSDRATADLMERFYQNLKAGGTTKAESLREAQVSLLKSTEFRHPRYWAPYLLIGNWL